MHDQSRLALGVRSATIKFSPPESPLDSSHLFTNKLLTISAAQSTSTITGAIDPATPSQIWYVRSEANPSTAIVNYSITGLNRDHIPLLSSPSKWRIIFAPPPTTKQMPSALAVPSPTPTAPAQFLLLNMADNSLLGLRPAQNGTLSLVEAKMSRNQENEDENMRWWESSIWQLMYEENQQFRDQFGWLIWCVVPETFPPPDGNYISLLSMSCSNNDLFRHLFHADCQCTSFSRCTSA